MSIESIEYEQFLKNEILDRDKKYDLSRKQNAKLIKEIDRLEEENRKLRESNRR